MSILNTPYNPTNLKLRARGIVSRGGWTAAGFVNYTNSYTDDRTGVSIPVASWTTADVTLGYKFGVDNGVLSDTSFILGVINITNARPPFVAGSLATIYPGLNFDGTNANPLGRVISLRLSKRF
jgi:iron complex outermembrane receptor protein